MKVGDSVKYKNDETCIGIVLEVGATMYKVKWIYNDVVEWMPEYALEVVNESR